MEESFSSSHSTERKNSRSFKVAPQRDTYNIRVTVYKAILDMKSFPDTGIRATLTRHGIPRIFLHKGDMSCHLDRNLSGTRITRRKTNISSNPFLLPASLGKIVKSRSKYQELEKDENQKNILHFGIDSIDTRYSCAFSPIPSEDQVTVNINIAYEYSEGLGINSRIFGVQSQVDLTSIIEKWVHKENEWIAKHQTSRNNVVPWFDFMELTVPLTKMNNISESIFPELPKNMDMFYESGASGKIRFDLGKLFVRIDIVNSAQLAREGNTIEPILECEPGIIDVMNGSFGHVLMEQFVKFYTPPVDIGWLYDIDSNTMTELIKQVWMICPPTTFLSLLNLACIYSNNPVETTFIAMKVIKKRAKAADRPSKVKWQEIYVEAEDCALHFLDNITNLPPSLFEEKEQLLQIVPTLAVKLESTRIVGHPLVQDHLRDRWERRYPIMCFGKNVKCIPEGSDWEFFNSPRCLFIGHAIAYIIFVIALVLPFLTVTDNSYYFSLYLQSQLIATSNGDFYGITDTDSFWDWATNVLAENIFLPDNLTGYLIPIDRALIRQFRVTPIPCNYFSGIYNPQNVNQTKNITKSITCLPDMENEEYWQKGEDWCNTKWNGTSPIDSEGNYILGSKLYSKGIPPGGYIRSSPFWALSQDLTELRNNGWFDERTRAVVLEIPVYNSNDGIFCVMVFLIEVSSTGAFFTTIQFYYLSQSELVNSLFPSDYNNPDYVGLLLFFMVIGFLLLEIREMSAGLKSYLLDFWNYTDILFFLATLSVYCIRFWLPGYLDPERVSALTLTYLTTIVSSRQTAYSFLVLWAFIRLMIYARQLKATAPLIVAMKEMIKNDIFNFFILGIIIVMGWSIVMTQLLKSSLIEYRNVGASLVTLLKAGLGDFNFVDSTGDYLHESISNVMLGVFSLVMLILLVNLLIAMMGSTFDDIKSEALNHWAFAMAQSVLYYEKPHWVPPFNIVGEVVSIVIWLSNTLTCGLVTKTTGVASDDIGLHKITDNVAKVLRTSEDDIEEEQDTSPSISKDIIRRIIFPKDSLERWSSNFDGKDNDD